MFTRRGDTGETDTGSRERVSKASEIINIEGNIDEAISFIGNALVVTKWNDLRADLISVQDDLFTLGEHLTANAKGRMLSAERTRWLEERTGAYRSEIGKIKLFVVPDGSVQSTSLHMARTVVRRLERITVASTGASRIDEPILSYLNRLSSLLFMQALVSNKRQGIEERIWPIAKTP